MLKHLSEKTKSDKGVAAQLLQEGEGGQDAPRPDLVIIADGTAAGRHALQQAAVAVADLDAEVVPPAVVAERVAAPHGGRVGRGHVAEAALAAHLVTPVCKQQQGSRTYACIARGSTTTEKQGG